MKKLYEALEMQITEFDTEDVIVTSVGGEESVESGTGEDGGEF